MGAAEQDRGVGGSVLRLQRLADGVADLGDFATGSPSSSMRLTKMMTSRARMLAIIRISAMSTVDSA
jgi:hypothetical protein